MISTIYNPAINKPLFKHSRYYKTLSRKSKLLRAEMQAYIQYEIDMEILNEGQMTLLELKQFINQLPDAFNDYEVENAEYMGNMVESFMGDNTQNVRYRLDKPVVAIYVREDTNEILIMNTPMEQYKTEDSE